MIRQKAIVRFRVRQNGMSVQVHAGVDFDDLIDHAPYTNSSPISRIRFSQKTGTVRHRAALVMAVALLTRMSQAFGIGVEHPLLQDSFFLVICIAILVQKDYYK